MAAPTWYNQGDQEIFKDNQFITQEKYRLGPYTPQETTTETAPTQNFGIPYTNAFTGGDNARPSFNYESSRNYQPGGMYEHNPLASGALDTVMNAQGQIVPNTRFGAGTHLNDPNLDKGDFLPNIRPGRSEFNPLEMSYMSELPESGQDLSRMEKLQMMARNYGGVDSAYGDYRTRGKLGNYMDKGIGMIPWLNQGVTSLAGMLGLQVGGDKSDRQRWAVDNAGFGQGTGRDQFGVYTGGKTLMGNTADYKTRMEDKVNEIKSFLDSGKKNSTLEAQLKDYEEKLGILNEDDDVKLAIEANRIKNRSRDYKIKEQIRKQTGEQGVYGLHLGEGEASEELAKKAPISVQVPDHISQPDTPSGGYTGAGGQPKGGAAAGPMSGGYGPWSKAQGGRVPFFYGGLAGIL